MPGGKLCSECNHAIFKTVYSMWGADTTWCCIKAEKSRSPCSPVDNHSMYAFTCCTERDKLSIRERILGCKRCGPDGRFWEAKCQAVN